MSTIDCAVSVPLEVAFAGGNVRAVFDRRVGPDDALSEHSLTVFVPRGFPPGDAIHVPGEGHWESEHRRGNVRVRVDVAPHEVFALDANGDLRCDVHVSLKEALCGVHNRTLVHPSGCVVRLQQAPGFVLRPGHQVVHPGRGYPNYPPVPAGNLVVTFHVDFPDHLTPDQCRALSTCL